MSETPQRFEVGIEGYIISNRYNGMLLKLTDYGRNQWAMRGFRYTAIPGRALAWTREPKRALLFTTYEQAVSFQREFEQDDHVIERVTNLQRARVNQKKGAA